MKCAHLVAIFGLSAVGQPPPRTYSAAVSSILRPGGDLVLCGAWHSKRAKPEPHLRAIIVRARVFFHGVCDNNNQRTIDDLTRVWAIASRCGTSNSTFCWAARRDIRALLYLLLGASARMSCAIVGYTTCCLLTR